MALTPWYLREIINDVYDPLRNLDNYFSHAYDQNFGLGLFNDDLLRRRPTISSLLGPLDTGYLRPLRPSCSDQSGVSTISNKPDQLQINLDVQQFKPDEVSVKIADGYLVVDGKHEEKQDKHGFISRQFTRRYKLPENVKEEDIKSTISSDGILSITAPKIIIQGSGKERTVPIQQTGQPAIKSTHKKEDDKMET